jgi:hypothetical protein
MFGVGWFGLQKMAVAFRQDYEEALYLDAVSIRDELSLKPE